MSKRPSDSARIIRNADRTNDRDNSLWESYIRNVTPLGSHDPQPAVESLVPPREGHQLDLHGMTLNDAFSATKSFLEKARAEHRSVTVITGLGGKIKYEFPFWMENDPSVSRIRPLNDGGAYVIYFHKKVQ